MERHMNFPSLTLGVSIDTATSYCLIEFKLCTHFKSKHSILEYKTEKFLKYVHRKTYTKIFIEGSLVENVTKNASQNTLFSKKSKLQNYLCQILKKYIK